MGKVLIKRGTSAAGAIAIILGGIYAAEGGYVNNKADRGGPTNLGVTEKVAREHGYLGDMRDFPKHCYDKITVCGDKIYVGTYIDKPGFRPLLTMDPGVAAEVSDTGVNMGPSVASKFLQASINKVCPAAKIAVDGKVGGRTINAYENCQAAIGKQRFCVRILDALDDQQKRRYEWIVDRNPSQRIFLKGWIAWRVGNVDRASCQ